MLSDHWEAFDVMTASPATDGAGAVTVTLTPSATVRALPVLLSQQTTAAGPGEEAVAAVDLIHEPDVLLSPGTLLRRQRDGALFRVTGDDSLRRTPASAETSAAVVRAERLVSGL